MGGLMLVASQETYHMFTMLNVTILRWIILKRQKEGLGTGFLNTTTISYGATFSQIYYRFWYWLLKSLHLLSLCKEWNFRLNLHTFIYLPFYLNTVKGIVHIEWRMCTQCTKCNGQTVKMVSTLFGSIQGHSINVNNTALPSNRSNLTVFVEAWTGEDIIIMLCYERQHLTIGLFKIMKLFIQITNI